MDYRITDPARAERFEKADSGPDLSGELKLLRLLAEEASQTPGSPLAVSCASAIGRLVERSQAVQIQSRGLMSADELRRLMFWVMSVLVQTSREFVPDHTADLLADRFYGRFKAGFAAFRASGELPALPDETRKES